jgi:hypothetical protein
VVANERRECGHGTSLTSSENSTKRSSLVVSGTLIDISAKAPVAIGHRPWSMHSDNDIQSIERDLTVISPLDVEGYCNVALTLCRFCRQAASAKQGRDRQHHSYSSQSNRR